MGLLTYLNRIKPRTGRLLTERGTYINEADLLERSNGSFDFFNNVRVAEYSPIVESKPLPYVDFIRNRLVPDDPSKVSIVSGEVTIDGTLAKQAVYTRKHGRYLPGLIGLAGIGIRMDTPDVGVYEFGYGNENNRIGLEVNNGEWYTFIESEGVRYRRKPRSEWDDPLDGTGDSKIDLLNIDRSKIILRIYIGWYGYTPMSFQLVIGDRIVDIDRINNTIDGVSIAQPDLPIFVEATGGVIHIGGRQYGAYGRYKPEDRVTTTPTITKAVGTTWEPVVSIRIKDLINLAGVPVQLSSIRGIVDEGVEYALFLNKPGALTGAVWQDIPETTSDGTALEHDSSATALTEGGYNVFSDRLAGPAKGNAVTPEALDLPDIDITPGLTLTLAARSTATTTNVEFKLRLREEW